MTTGTAFFLESLSGTLTASAPPIREGQRAVADLTSATSQLRPPPKCADTMPAGGQLLSGE